LLYWNSFGDKVQSHGTEEYFAAARFVEAAQAKLENYSLNKVPK